MACYYIKSCNFEYHVLNIVSYVPFVQGKKLTDPQTLQLHQYKIHEEENNSSFLLESQFC